SVRRHQEQFASVTRQVGSDTALLGLKTHPHHAGRRQADWTDFLFRKTYGQACAADKNKVALAGGPAYPSQAIAFVELDSLEGASGGAGEGLDLSPLHHALQRAEHQIAGPS